MLTIEKQKELLKEVSEFQSRLSLKYSVDFELKYSVFGRKPRQSIIDLACKYFEVPVSDLKSDKKDNILVRVRMFVSYYLREEYGLGSSEIGKMLKRSHASILHVQRRLHNELSLYKTARIEYENFAVYLNGQNAK